MTDLMFGEFAKYQVLPLDASVATRMVAPRPILTAGRKVFTYSGDADHRHPRFGTAPSLLNTSYTITAEIDVPQGGARRHDRDRRAAGSAAMVCICLKASQSSPGTCWT